MPITETNDWSRKPTHDGHKLSAFKVMSGAVGLALFTFTGNALFGRTTVIQLVVVDEMMKKCQRHPTIDTGQENVRELAR